MDPGGESTGLAAVWGCYIHTRIRVHTGLRLGVEDKQVTEGPMINTLWGLYEQHLKAGRCRGAVK